jgi:hypothetical protein
MSAITVISFKINNTLISYGHRTLKQQIVNWMSYNLLLYSFRAWFANVSRQILYSFLYHIIEIVKQILKLQNFYIYICLF